MHGVIVQDAASTSGVDPWGPAGINSFGYLVVALFDENKPPGDLAYARRPLTSHLHQDIHPTLPLHTETSEHHTMSRVWHITGANTGLGLALALKALSEGDRVVAAVRTPSNAPESLQRPDVKVLRFDLAWDLDEMNEYAERAFGAFGQLDVLVNNAGFAYMGAIEESE